MQVCSSGNGEDPSCSDSLALPISIPDHLDYLRHNISTLGCDSSDDTGAAAAAAAAAKAQALVDQMFGV